MTHIESNPVAASQALRAYNRAGLTREVVQPRWRWRGGAHTGLHGQLGGSSSPSVFGAVEAGDGGGELFDPSTWMKAAPSTGAAGDTALPFFLALVIAGEMTGLLLAGLAWAGAVSTATGPTASAVAATLVFSLAEGSCCFCNKGCWGICCCCCCSPGCCCSPCCCMCRWCCRSGMRCCCCCTSCMCCCCSCCCC